MPGAYAVDVDQSAALTTNVQYLDEPAGLFTRLFRPATPERTGAERVDWGIERRARETAGFVPVQAEAIFVGDRQFSRNSILPLNIALQQSINAGDIAHDRGMDGAIYVGPEGNPNSTDSYMRRMSRYQEDMRARIANTHEWIMSTAVMRGAMTYSVAGFDSFTYDFGRDASLDTVAGAFWDVDSTGAEEDIQTIKRLVGNLAYTTVTMAFCPSDVAALLRSDSNLRTMLDTRNLNENGGQSSFIDNQAPYEMQGAVTPIGRIAGVEFWEYERSLTIGGSTVPMIEAKHIYFASAPGQTDVRYTSHPVYDFDVAPGRPIITDYFSKSWTIPHPSQERLLLQHHFMIAPYRPDAFATLQVIS